ncbi:MAG TPA: hypothetical protein VK961_25720 [Chthoniobacter sp.]|nr:hypothetical protein [Chthoniobacter sp.]
MKDLPPVRRDYQTLLLLSWFGIFLSFITICHITSAIRTPGIKTSSFDPWYAAAIFLPTGVLSLFTRGHWAARRTIPLACVLCFGGMALLFYVDHTNRYLSYMEWMHRSKEGLLPAQSIPR